ncbi:MAG: helix-turn-helix domain-containing protein [Thermotogota bacterium]
MYREYYTVKQIAHLLELHEKTVQRYIREGKIKAQKVGKSWRISKDNLDDFTGKTEEEQDETRKKNNDMGIRPRAMVSTVVDIDECEREEAIRISNTLTAILNSRNFEFGNSTMHTQYIEQEKKLRLMLWGHLEFMENIIASISALVD